tara:strand:+ start:9291 stop:9722 length:432 start_codon:yes stop_codon:yes gene_type:complete
MSISTLPTTSSVVEIVYCDDPDVTPGDESSRGWILSDLATAQPDADILVVRPLNVDERARTTDVEGRAQMMLARARAGVVSVNGKTGEKARSRWIDGCPDDAVFLLGLVVGALTNNVDHQLMQRLVLGLVDEDEDEETDAEED